MLETSLTQLCETDTPMLLESIKMLFQEVAGVVISSPKRLHFSTTSWLLDAKGNIHPCFTLSETADVQHERVVILSVRL